MATPLCFLRPERVGGFLFQEVEAEGLGIWTQSTAEGGGAILATGELSGNLQVHGEITFLHSKPFLHLASRTLAASLISLK